MSLLKKEINITIANKSEELGRKHSNYITIEKLIYNKNILQNEDNQILQRAERHRCRVSR